MKTKTGGPNGSIRNQEEYSHGANNGLKIALDFCGELSCLTAKLTDRPYHNYLRFIMTIFLLMKVHMRIN